MVFRLSVTYHDLRSVREFQDKTILAVKAPPDTVLTCDAQEVWWTVGHRSVLFNGVPCSKVVLWEEPNVFYREVSSIQRVLFQRFLVLFDLFTLHLLHTSLAVHVDGLCVILLTMG